MKVLYVLPTDIMYGDNIALFNLLPHLTNKNIEPLFMVIKDSETSCYLRSNGYKIINVSHLISNLWPEKRGIYPFLWQVIQYVKDILYLRDMKDIIEDIISFSPDIIHTNNSTCAIGYYIAKQLGVPHVWHIREYGDLDINRSHFPTKREVERKMKSNFNYNITITADIMKHFHLSERTKIIYDGPITCEPSPIIYPKEKFFLFVGRLTQQKGVEEVIKAFSMFRKYNTDYSLLLAGSGKSEYVEYLKKMSKELSISENVHFLGYRKDVKNLMAKTAALIVSSRYEAFGFITAEAMHMGCMVIGKNTAGTKEQFDNLDNHLKQSFCYRYKTTDELYNCMMRVISKDLPISILVEMQRYVTQTYSARESALSVLKLYNEIFARKRDQKIKI